jgi:hypothetical protein
MADRRRGGHDFAQSPRARAGTNRTIRIAAACISVVILVIQLPVLLQAFSAPDFNGYAGIDYQLYMDATRRWIEGGPFYEPYQLAGPYLIGYGDVLYPPVALVLFVPFTVLPAVLWWAIPIATTLVVLVWLRPSAVVWPLMAACVGWQPAHIHIISGNPTLWVMAAVALGTVFRWPSVLALIKPSLFVFAFVGARDRAWWIGLAVFLGVCALFLPMWLDWFAALLNSRGGSLFYSWQEATMPLLPILAWLGRPGGRYGHGERRTVAIAQ